MARHEDFTVAELARTLERIERTLDRRLRHSITEELVATDRRWADLEVGL